MSANLRRDDVDKFFDYNIHIPSRTLYMGPETDEKMAEYVVKGMHLLESIRLEPITIIMNTIGGDEYDGLAVYDAIDTSKCHVTVIVYGSAMSMGSWILQAADDRVMAPHATLMMHNGSYEHEMTVDKFHDQTGLGRTSGGLQGELQYRASGDFDATTYALYARGWFDAYESKLRSGSRLSVGANARRSLTDRIDVFGELGAHWRRAESDVFEGREFAARLNFDYSLGTAGTAYLTGEYRRGDTFASGFGDLWNLNNAEVFVRDDALEGGEFFAHRFEADTVLGTLGYNRPLGPRDSIDFSYRRVRTKPLDATGSGPSKYDVNQYFILYLMRF